MSNISTLFKTIDLFLCIYIWNFITGICLFTTYDWILELCHWYMVINASRLSLVYNKIRLLICLQYSKSDLFNNIDHMRILGTETSWVILSQTQYFQKL